MQAMMSGCLESCANWEGSSGPAVPLLAIVVSGTRRLDWNFSRRQAGGSWKGTRRFYDVAIPLENTPFEAPNETDVI